MVQTTRTGVRLLLPDEVMDTARAMIFDCEITSRQRHFDFLSIGICLPKKMLSLRWSGHAKRNSLRYFSASKVERGLRYCCFSARNTAFALKWPGLSGPWVRAIFSSGHNLVKIKNYANKFIFPGTTWSSPFVWHPQTDLIPKFVVPELMAFTSNLKMATPLPMHRGQSFRVK